MGNDPFFERTVAHYSLLPKEVTIDFLSSLRDPSHDFASAFFTFGAVS